MKFTIELSYEDLQQALLSYVQQHITMPDSGQIAVELIPGHGVKEPTAVIAVGSNPVVTTDFNVVEESFATDDPEPTPVVEEDPLNNDPEPDRDEVIRRCEAAGIKIKEDGAQRAKRTSVLLQELEAVKEIEYPESVEESIPEIETEAVKVEEDELDIFDNPDTAPEEENVIADDDSLEKLFGG